MKLEYQPDFIEQELRTLKDEHLYRKLRIVQNKGSSAIIDGRKVLNLNSNDYLGLSRHNSVISETTRAIEEISPCSSRLVDWKQLSITRFRIPVGCPSKD